MTHVERSLAAHGISTRGEAGDVIRDRGPGVGDGLDRSAAAEIDRLLDLIAAGERRERALTEELQHRVRNTLATIRSIYRQSMSTETAPKDSAERFQGRLNAIARSQTYTGSLRSSGIEIEDLVRDELLPTHCLDGPRCSIDGPAVRLHDKQAELMALAIHELATNAVEFGALGQDGTVSIRWSLTPEGVHFRWCEEGVPVVTSAPRRSGFGRQVIEEALPYQLGATTGFQLRPGGVECTIDLPMSGTSDPGVDDQQEADDAQMLPARSDGLG